MRRKLTRPYELCALTLSSGTTGTSNSRHWSGTTSAAPAAEPFNVTASRKSNPTSKAGDTDNAMPNVGAYLLGDEN
jgi:hypothetical protein